MNTVIETLYLRRPRIEYVSPPVCPVIFSASGIAIFEQCFQDQSFCPLGKINTNFLEIPEPANAVAFNVYFSTKQSGQPFQLVVDGLLAKQAVVFTGGLYWFTVNTALGESAPFPPMVAPNQIYTRLIVPGTSDALSFNLYKDGVKLISGFTGTVVESSAQGWYQATKITTDGESPITGCTPILLSGTVPVPPPPPPPPPPGPNWATDFNYGSPVCLGCLGVVVSGHVVVSGGFTPPSANFATFAELIGGNPAVEYIQNQAGWVDGTYTGPAAHCKMSVAVVLTGVASANTNTAVQVVVNGVSVVNLQGAAVTSGDYIFSLPAGTSSIRIIIQAQAVGSSSIQLSGGFSNIP